MLHTPHGLLAATAPAAPWLTLADAPLWLLSWYKPLLVLPPLLAWAWVVSTIYDKDAQEFYLKRRAWNAGHMLVAVAAVGFLLAAPLTFWITWPVLILALAADLGLYFYLRNNDDRVPEQRRWSLNPAEIIEAQAEDKKKKKRSKSLATSLVFRRGRTEIAPPEKETPEFELRLAAEELVKGMFEARASQMDIGPVKEKTYLASVLVDGVRQPLRQLPANEATAVIDFYKHAAGLDVEDRRRKQKSDDLEIGQSATSTVPVRVTTIGSSAGMRLTMLVDPVKQVSMRIDDLGLLDNQLKDVRELVHDQRGVVVLAGLPDGGRTSLMYALIREHDAYTSNVQTIEVDPQSVIEGVRHNVWNPQEAAEYATLVRSILRRDPDVVGVAELPDEATAQEIAKGADSANSRVYAVVKADDPLKALQIYAQMVGDQKLAARALHGVIGVKLIRRLCSNCKLAFQPTPDILKKLGLPPNTKQLYRKGGRVLVKDKEETCPVCGGSGYFGQEGAFAVHPLDDAGRSLVAQNNLSNLRSEFRQKKQQSIQQAALQKVIDGVTSIEEVVRITGGGGGKGAPQKKPAAAKPAGGQQPAGGAAS